MASVQKISPFLMFDGPVEEAAKFYVSVFPNSEIKSASPMSATIMANGTEILMFDDWPHFKFSPGISLFVKCKDQKRSTSTGTSSSPAAAGKTIASAFRTSGASPGRSSPTPSAVSSAILIARKPTASCRPCSR